MRNVVWMPLVSFGACVLAVLAAGAHAQAAGNPSCTPPGPRDEAGTPGVTGWTGPPSVDGALDDGSIPGYFDGGGSILDMLGMRPSTPLPTPFSYTTVAPPYADVAGCMAFDAQGHPDSHNCLCQNCFTMQQQCDALPGCRAVQKCGSDTNCTANTASCTLAQALYPALACDEATTCYFLPSVLGTQGCASVIDTWGNGSVSIGLATNLGACAKTNNCPTQ